MGCRRLLLCTRRSRTSSSSLGCVHFFEAPLRSSVPPHEDRRNGTCQAMAADHAGQDGPLTPWLPLPVVPRRSILHSCLLTLLPVFVTACAACTAQLRSGVSAAGSAAPQTGRGNVRSRQNAQEAAGSRAKLSMEQQAKTKQAAKVSGMAWWQVAAADEGPLATAGQHRTLAADQPHPSHSLLEAVLFPLVEQVRLGAA